MDEFSKKENMGKFFLKDGKYYRLISYCDQPTATLQAIGSERHIGGAIGSPNLSGFELLPDTIQNVIEDIISQVNSPQSTKGESE